MSFLDDFSDLLEGFKEMGQELDALKSDIVSSLVEPIKDLNSSVNDSSKELLGGDSAPQADTPKNLPPAGE